MRLEWSFTTEDGSWEENGKSYSIERHEAELYGELFRHAGGATHIYVAAPRGAMVSFVNRYDGKGTMAAVGAEGFVNFPMAGSSGYWPALGETGPWDVYVANVKVASGVGLPEHHHVSTFLVVGEGDVVPQPNGKDIIQLYVNGVLVWNQ